MVDFQKLLSFIHDPSWTEVKTGRAWDMYGNEDRRRLDTHRSEREGHLWGGGGEGEAIKMSASSCLLSLNSHHVQASPLHLFIFVFVLVLDLILVLILIFHIFSLHLSRPIFSLS